MGGSIYATDIENHLMLTGCHMANIETLRSLLPKRPRHLRTRHFSFSTAEEATAWMLSRLARRYVHNHKGEYGAGAEYSLPLETWVLSPSLQITSPLTGWFADEPANTSFRLVIHRCPTHFRDYDVRPCWDYVYGYLRRSLKMSGNKRPDEGTRANTTRFLDELLAAYRQNADAVNSTFHKLGHPYWESNGSSFDPYT